MGGCVYVCEEGRRWKEREGGEKWREDKEVGKGSFDVRTVYVKKKKQTCRSGT